ncbi:Fe-S oxidoreductase [Stieleria sp. TO1_6]|nr:Fe-S oxidoreductase [Stieleria tagensis]
MSEREPQRDVSGEVAAVDVSTVFLTASRCPVGCAMCDLHLNTLPHPTERGAIAEQIRFAHSVLPAAPWIKLYNSGNFFDPASIPPADYTQIAALCDRYQRVIVENHPRFGRQRHQRFRDQLNGTLEIAVGLETVQPRILKRLGKQMSRDDFDGYARCLRDWSIDLRVFLIVGSPGMSVVESIRWARMSVRHALLTGARHVSLIPARAGHGWNGAAHSLPDIRPNHLADLFVDCLDDVAGATCLSVDLWGFHQADLPVADQQLLSRLESAVLRQDADQL